MGVSRRRAGVRCRFLISRRILARKTIAATRATAATIYRTSSEPSPPSGETPNHCSIKLMSFSLLQTQFAGSPIAAD